MDKINNNTNTVHSMTNKSNKENLEHLLFSCSNATPIWSYAKKILDKVWPGVTITRLEALSETWREAVSNKKPCTKYSMIYGII